MPPAGSFARNPHTAESLDSVPSEIRPDWENYLNDIVGVMWSRPALAGRERSLLTVAALTAQGCTTELDIQVRIAGDHGVTRVELCETVLQVGGYAGLGVAREALVVLRKVFEASAIPRGKIGQPPRPDEIDFADPLDRLTAIMRLRHPEWGPDVAVRFNRFHPEVAFSPTQSNWQDWVMETAFGGLWSRPNLTLRERELVTIAALVVSGRPMELGSHLRGGIALGISPEELGEGIMHLAVYAGYAASVDAMHVLGKLVEEEN